MDSPIYVLKSNTEVLYAMLDNMGFLPEKIKKYKLLMQRCAQINPDVGFPLIYLEPNGILKKLDVMMGEQCVLGTETSDEHVTDKLVGLIETDPRVDTILWFQDSEGYDWSRQVSELEKNYDLKIDDLVLDSVEIN
jgi:hypothetical protein